MLRHADGRHVCADADGRVFLAPVSASAPAVPCLLFVSLFVSSVLFSLLYWSPLFDIVTALRTLNKRGVGEYELSLLFIAGFVPRVGVV